MKKLALLIIPIIILVGCKNFDDLEAGNKIALENQNNLEKNTMRAFENYKKMLVLYAGTVKQWADVVGEEEAEKLREEATKTMAKLETAEAQQNETAEQLAIGRAWLLVEREAIKQDSLNSDLLGKVIADLPAWIKEGKDIYDHRTEM